MRRFGISRRALADFDEILDYLTGVAGHAVADKYGRDIQASIVRLAEMPGLGSPRPELGADVKVVIVRPYLVFYEASADEDSVFVLRILHGRRNITRAVLRLR